MLKELQSMSNIIGIDAKSKDLETLSSLLNKADKLKGYVDMANASIKNLNKSVLYLSNRLDKNDWTKYIWLTISLINECGYSILQTLWYIILQLDSKGYLTKKPRETYLKYYKYIMDHDSSSNYLMGDLDKSSLPSQSLLPSLPLELSSLIDNDLEKSTTKTLGRITNMTPQNKIDFLNKLDAFNELSNISDISETSNSNEFMAKMMGQFTNMMGTSDSKNDNLEQKLDRKSRRLIVRADKKKQKNSNKKNALIANQSS
jgi:hypothetical protein